MSKFIRTLKNEETNEAYINIKIKNSVANSEELKSELKKVLTEKDEEIVKPSIPGGIINAIPQIEASDKVINLGEKFEPLTGVIATDKEDGNITEKVKERIKSEKIADSPSFWDRKGAISTLFLKNVPNILKYHKVLLDIITEM